MSSGSKKTREEILKAAWRLLEHSRGSEVRMSDIARAAGVSRQAVYLHFPTRTNLLVATTLYIDEVKNVDERLVNSRSAETGIERVDAFIDAWCNYIPEVYAVAKALMIMGERDEAARNAWDGRMQAVREGCRAAIDDLDRDSTLSPKHSTDEATEILCAVLSVETWEHLVLRSGWEQKCYIKKIKVIVADALVAQQR